MEDALGSGGNGELGRLEAEDLKMGKSAVFSRSPGLFLGKLKTEDSRREKAGTGRSGRSLRVRRKILISVAWARQASPRFFAVPRHGAWYSIFKDLTIRVELLSYRAR